MTPQIGQTVRPNCACHKDQTGVVTGFRFDYAQITMDSGERIALPPSHYKAATDEEPIRE